MTIHSFDLSYPLSDEKIKDIIHQQSEHYFISSSLWGDKINDYLRLVDSKHSAFQCTAFLLNSFLVISPNLMGDLSIKVHFNEEILSEPIVDFKFNFSPFFNLHSESISLESRNEILGEKIEEINQKELEFSYSYDLSDLFQYWENQINDYMSASFPQFSKVNLIQEAQHYFKKEGYFNENCELIGPIIQAKNSHRFHSQLEHNLPLHPPASQHKI